jgi:hypothetical protein
MKIFGDKEPHPAMNYIMELETKIRGLQQDKQDLRKAMLYLIATKGPITMGIGFLGGACFGAALTWLIWGSK